MAKMISPEKGIAEEARPYSYGAHPVIPFQSESGTNGTLPDITTPNDKEIADVLDIVLSATESAAKK